MPAAAAGHPGNTWWCTKWLHAVGGLAQVLYVGDHIYGDILRSKKTLGWRTMLVLTLHSQSSPAQESTHSSAPASRLSEDPCHFQCGWRLSDGDACM
jgi:ribonucleotide monophosphatase NagD (HAD superfamily)